MNPKVSPKIDELIAKYIPKPLQALENSSTSPSAAIFENKICFSLREASTLTGLSIKTLRRAISVDELKVSRIGRRILLRRENIETWLQKKESL